MKADGDTESDSFSTGVKNNRGNDGLQHEADENCAFSSPARPLESLLVFFTQGFFFSPPLQNVKCLILPFCAS